MLLAFRDYLVQKAVVQEKYVPFYLKWVSDGYSFLDQSDSQVLSLEQKQQFLKHLSKTHEDWQVKQADNALRLYSYFLSSHQRNTASNSPDTREWDFLEARTRNALRIRQRSYSTEKTYITWLRAFRRFVLEKEPTHLTSGDIQIVQIGVRSTLFTPLFPSLLFLSPFQDIYL